MIDVVMTPLVVVVFIVVTALLASRYPRSLRPLVWLALFEYLACAAAQLAHNRIEGGDATYYREIGVALARFLDESFGWANGELFALLVHQPSAFDSLVVGPGTNTGSMAAASAWIMFLVRGSEYASQAMLGGLAMVAALAIFDACRDAYPSGSPARLFVATVLFPSVAFWTSALHKESFCLMGTGLLFAAWRATRQRRLRGIVYAAAGLVLITMFRAPALPPLILGLVTYAIVDRLRKTRGKERALVGPIYLMFGLGALALAMLLVTWVSPELGIDRLGESVLLQQRSWRATEGGSSFDIDEPLAQTPGEQLLRVPLALANALLRPQLFDVTSPLVLISAIEMSVLAWLIVRAFRLNGARGMVARIQRTPFLLMCAVITFVGCTFVGLTTLNFGSLSRYRVPFLPFYGALLAVLTDRLTLTAPTQPGPVVGTGALRGRVRVARRSDS